MMQGNRQTSLPLKRPDIESFAAQMKVVESRSYLAIANWVFHLEKELSKIARCNPGKQLRRSQLVVIAAEALAGYEREKEIIKKLDVKSSQPLRDWSAERTVFVNQAKRLQAKIESLELLKEEYGMKPDKGETP